MKKSLIAALVGGLIIFLWQFFSYAAGNLHGSAAGYTEKQDVIMKFLESQQLPEGGYVLPNLPATAGMEEWEALMKNGEGKPWASIQYHAQMKNSNVQNMIRGFGVNVIIILLFTWIVAQFRLASFGKILGAALAVGLIVFLNAPYTGNIWYPAFDIWVHLADAIVSWGLAGLWLGWYLTRTQKKEAQQQQNEKAFHMAE